MLFVDVFVLFVPSYTRHPPFYWSFLCVFLLFVKSLEIEKNGCNNGNRSGNALLDRQIDGWLDRWMDDCKATSGF